MIEYANKTIEEAKLFGLKFPFTKDDLKKRYRVLVMEYHPDKNPNSKICEEKIKVINVAYENLIKIALDKVEVKTSLSEELRKKWDQEEEDMFSIFNPCSECNGSRVSYVFRTIRQTCSNCGGSGIVKLKCKYCSGTGIFTNKFGRKVPCRACNETGIWKEVYCKICNRKSRRGFFSNWARYYEFGIEYTEKKIEVPCPKCGGRGKIKYEPLNPVIRPGAILRAKSKKK